MDLNKLSQLLVEAAYKAGEYIRQEFHDFDSNAVEYKSKNNLVSYVDKQAEKIIIDYLQTTGIGLIAEEGHNKHKEIKGLNWIIDPLDGTVNFVHGIPHFAVSLALGNDNEILAGVVYHVINDELYHAVKGGGAYKNGKVIKISPVTRLEESVLATGFPYNKFDHTEEYFKIFNDFMRSTHGIRRFGSAALDLAWVAEGRYEAFFEYNLSSWDLAAGALLVEEAGGKVTDFNGGNNFLSLGNIVAGGAMVNKMLETIEEHWLN